MILSVGSVAAVDTWSPVGTGACGTPRLANGDRVLAWNDNGFVEGNVIGHPTVVEIAPLNAESKSERTPPEWTIKRGSPLPSSGVMLCQRHLAWEVCERRAEVNGQLRVQFISDGVEQLISRDEANPLPAGLVAVQQAQATEQLRSLRVAQASLLWRPRASSRPLTQGSHVVGRQNPSMWSLGRIVTVRGDTAEVAWTDANTTSSLARASIVEFPGPRPTHPGEAIFVVPEGSGQLVPGRVSELGQGVVEVIGLDGVISRVLLDHVIAADEGSPAAVQTQQ